MPELLFPLSEFWLLSLSIMCSRLSHAVACISTSFLYMVGKYSPVYHILFIHSSVDKHLGGFHFWTVMNNAALNIHDQVFVWMLLPLQLSGWAVNPQQLLGSHYLVTYLSWLNGGSWKFMPGAVTNVVLQAPPHCHRIFSALHLSPVLPSIAQRQVQSSPSNDQLSQLLVILLVFFLPWLERVRAFPKSFFTRWEGEDK